jgi:hypothetical protein
VDEHVEVPMNKVAFLELVGLVFDTSFILEDELEDGRTSPDKIDRYFYETIWGLLRNNGSRPYIPFK